MRTIFMLLVSISLTGCLTALGTPACEMPDAGPDTGPVGDPTVTDHFRITLLTNPVVLVPDEGTAVMVRIDRAPGYDLPVLVELFGMPEGVDWLSREEREEDPDGIVIVYLHTDEFGARDFTVPHFVVQGSDGTGLRQSDHGVYEAMSP